MLEGISQLGDNGSRADQRFGYEAMTDTRPTILVDLDRTLLNTGAYTEELWRQVAAVKSGVNVAAEMELVNNKCFYQPLGTTHTQGAYSFEAHLTDLLARRGESNDAFAIHALQGQVRENFSDARGFLYEHAEGLLAELSAIGHVSIITFGFLSDQEAKLARLPGLNDTPAIITQEDKATYIREHFPATAEVWLIDDRLYDNMPSNCQTVLIDHEAKQQGAHNGAQAVHDLYIAENLIKEHYAPH